MHLVSMFDESVVRFPHKSALVCGERRLSYTALQQHSLRAAAVLQDHGVVAGDRVAAMCLNTPGFVIAALAALRLGAVFVPVNHKLQAPEVDSILRHCRARICIADAALAPVARRVPAPVVWMSTEGAVEGWAAFDDLVAAATVRALPAPCDHEAVAQILYTSGTTGEPKGCLHTHRGVFTTAMVAALAFGVTRNERTLIAMPIWHAAPLNNFTFSTLLMGGTLVLLREYSPRGMLETVQREQTTLLFAAPVALLAPVDLPGFEDFDLRSMRLWVYGGGPLGKDMALRLMQAYGSDQFMQVYGMTEAGPLGTALFPEDAVRKAGSIGRSSLAGVRVRVVDPDGRETQPGGIGEVVLQSESNMQGYLDAPQATAAVYDAAGWYHSGDLARVDEDGYFYVVDRIKDMIVTGGENVYSKEVEDALSPHPDIADVAVIGRPHPQWGETVVAVIVARPAATVTDEALQAFLSDRLARYKIPREFHRADALPRTPSGKLQKHLLRKNLFKES